MIPYRLDLAGGWLDQPFISGIYAGSVVTLSIKPIVEYEERCGMATSTRRTIKNIYSLGLPNIDSIELAKLIFNLDNKPGAKNISGAQDAIGLCIKGLSRHFYSGKYWPRSIEICQDDGVLDWLENHIFLKLLYPRPQEFDVLAKTNIDYDLIKVLSEASKGCWSAIMDKDLQWFANYITGTFEAQKRIFPLMAVNDVPPKCMGYKFAGAGGGGYWIMINDTPCGDKIKINR